MLREVLEQAQLAVGEAQVERGALGALLLEVDGHVSQNQLLRPCLSATQNGVDPRQQLLEGSTPNPTQKPKSESTVQTAL